MVRPASAQNFPAPQNFRAIQHVVVVGLSGLRWSQITPGAAPALWHMADQGSVGALVDYAVGRGSFRDILTIVAENGRQLRDLRGAIMRSRILRKMTSCTLSSTRRREPAQHT